MVNEMSKRAQTTIFVIIAIVIVSILGILFFMFGGPSLIGGEEVQPNVFVRQCIEDGVEEALEILLPQGGFINTRNNSIIYENNPVQYLCYNKGFYASCRMQHPAYLKEVENEIIDYIRPRLENCFESLEKNLELRGFSVETESKMDIEVKFVPDKVRVNVERSVKTITKEETRIFDKFESQITHPIYELAMIAITIASQEARYCNFEYLGYQLTYPKYGIKYEMLSDSSKFYSITDKLTGEKLVIAIRGCAMPYGI